MFASGHWPAVRWNLQSYIIWQKNPLKIFTNNVTSNAVSLNFCWLLFEKFDRMPSDDISKTARVSSRSTDNNPQSKKEVFQMDSLWTLSLKSLTERQQLMMEEMSPLFNRLHVNESDFQLFHQSFQSINASLSETIDVDQLELVLKLQQTPFNRRFLRMFDMGKIGKVDLWDFFIMTWNYCTLDREKLGDVVKLSHQFSVSSRWYHSVNVWW